MTREPISISLQEARRLTVTKQRLAGPGPKGSPRRTIPEVVRELGYVQWDPVTVVAPAHELTLWSRVGNYRRSDLERLLWQEKRLFQGWGHAASLLSMDDYAIHYSLMRRYPECLSSGWGRWKAWTRQWLPKHRDLRRSLLRTLRKGARTANQFPEHARTRSSGSGWGSGSDVSAMLFHLWMGGDVMIVGHEGRQNVWGLTETFLPGWAERTLLPAPEVEARFAERALRALGVASPREIHLSFPNGHYLDLPGALTVLERSGRIVPVRVSGLEERGPRYIHEEDLPAVEALRSGSWEPRTSILGPFDNLLTVRDRADRLFGFRFAHENYVPRAKRRFGVYVMPVLQGDRFLGRVAPRLDRERRRLVLEGVHAEPHAPIDRESGAEVAHQLERLAEFLGATAVEYPRSVPAGWRSSLR